MGEREREREGERGRERERERASGGSGGVVPVLHLLALKGPLLHYLFTTE